MTIAELFVNLGVKGSDVSVRAISSVKSGLEEATSSGLALKAAILAALYGLEKFTGMAGERGMELEKFSNFTGLSTDKLQKWQYAMKMSGVEAKDVEGSIKGLQSSMLKMSIGEGAPKGMQRLSEVLKGGLDKNKWTDAFYMMDKLREYSRKEKNVALRNETMSSFGLSESMTQGMATGKIDPNKVSASKILGHGDIDQLSRVNTAWLEFHHTLELFGQQFIAKHGLSAVKDISKVTDQVLKLVSAFASLAEKLRVFEVISTVFEGWNNIFSWVNAGVDKVSGMVPDKSKNKTPVKDVISGFMKKLFTPPSAEGVDFARPKMPAGLVPSAKGHNANVKVDVHNHGVKDMKEGAHHVEKAVRHAYYTLQSQTQVT